MRVEPCVCCNKPSECRIWGVPACNKCFSAWYARPEFEAGAIDPDGKLSLEAYGVKAADLTRRWVGWYRRQLAAQRAVEAQQEVA